MLEGLGLEPQSKDFEIVTCFTAYVMQQKQDHVLSFPLHNQR